MTITSATTSAQPMNNSARFGGLAALTRDEAAARGECRSAQAARANERARKPSMIARCHRCAGAIRVQDEGLKAAANEEGGDPVTELVRERGERTRV